MCMGEGDREMKAIRWILLYGFIALVGGIVFAALWIRLPALWIINLPEPVWLDLMDLFDAHCCESAHDLQFLIAIVFGTLLTSLFILTIHLVKKLW